MLDAFVTTATPATALAARALALAVSRRHPGVPVVVVTAEDAVSGTEPGLDGAVVWPTADLGVAAGIAVAETLHPADQVALCLPYALRRAVAAYGSAAYLEPGLLVVSPLDEVAQLLETHPFVLAGHVIVRERHVTVPELDAVTRHDHAVSGRIAAVGRDAGPLLDVWEGAARETCLDPRQRRPSHLTDVLPARLLAWPGVAVATERTLQSFTEHAAIKAGRAVGALGAVVEVDPLLDMARGRLASTAPVDVELQLLNANVHDSRPLLPLVELIDEVARPDDARPAVLPRLESFRRDLRLAADPLGRRWPAGDRAAFDAWLAEENRLGTTRLAHLWWRAHPALQRVLPDPKRTPAPMRLWSRTVGTALIGVDLFDPAAALRPAAGDRNGGSGRVAHALHWRLNVVRGLVPGGERRRQRRTTQGSVTSRSPGDIADALRWRAQVVRGLAPGAAGRRRTRPARSLPAGAAPTLVQVDRQPLAFGPAPRSLTLIGLLRSESGLGQAARSSLAALRLLGRDFSHVDTSDLYPSRNAVAPGLKEADFGATGDVNLIHANAGELVAWGDLVFRHRLAGRFNAAMCFWETANLPPYLRGVFDVVDELWLASRYLADVFGQYGRVPVRVVGLAAELPEARDSDRAAFGLRDDEFVFLFVYDALSAHGRKNPEKALEAFVKAFAPDFPGVRFVLKVSNLNKFPSSEARLRTFVDRYPAITLIDDYLPREGVLDLMAAADVYVSLHASEGFGLTLLEAMALGTPVVCTAYSGNMDFTTAGNSWLVDYEMVATPTQTGPYPPGSVWASPRVDSAADLMRAARDAPAEVTRKRERAMADARAAAALEPYAARLDEQLRRVL